MTPFTYMELTRCYLLGDHFSLNGIAMRILFLRWRENIVYENLNWFSLPSNVKHMSHSWKINENRKTSLVGGPSRMLSHNRYRLSNERHRKTRPVKWCDSSSYSSHPHLSFRHWFHIFDIQRKKCKLSSLLNYCHKSSRNYCCQQYEKWMKTKCV